MRVKRLCLAGSLWLLAPLLHADQLVFGSFGSSQNAQNWAAKLSAMFGQPVTVQSGDNGLHRVLSANLDADGYALLARRATSAGIQFWRLRSDAAPVVPPAPAAGQAIAGEPPAAPAQTETGESAVRAPQPLGAARLQPPSPVAQPGLKRKEQRNERYEWDIGVESRVFGERGLDGQDRVSASIAAQLEYFRGWAGDTRSITFTPFVRIDSADEDRTHADLREFYYSRIGQNSDLHIGAKRVFWGVTEFHHLIDVVNQTDLIENVDTEDKLGQPMVQWSTVRNWGMLDVYALLGFRERTFAGEDGRLRLPFKVLSDASYASGAEQKRVDAAIRWSHYVGPFEFGLHHFSGTSREPMLMPELGRGGAVVLRPYYPVIDQSGIDAQAFYGDWAFKLEGFSRSGFGERYAAANIGFERTFVGVLGSRADFGLVAEYMWDERGDDAFNTLFEHDLALGGRFQLNDFADTKALLGVIVDTDNDDYVVSLEASRRLGNSWLMSLEGRLFGGGKTWRADTPVTLLRDPDFKSAWLQEDDYLQLELKKFL